MPGREYVERPGSKRSGIVLYDKSKGIVDNGPYKDKNTRNLDARCHSRMTPLIFYFGNGEDDGGFH